MNNELLKEFQEDKKGILDIRIRTTAGKQIDVEIQVLPNEFMAERSVWKSPEMKMTRLFNGWSSSMQNREECWKCCQKKTRTSKRRSICFR